MVMDIFNHTRGRACWRLRRRLYFVSRERLWWQVQYLILLKILIIFMNLRSQRTILLNIKHTRVRFIFISYDTLNHLCTILVILHIPFFTYILRTQNSHSVIIQVLTQPYSDKKSEYSLYTDFIVKLSPHTHNIWIKDKGSKFKKKLKYLNGFSSSIVFYESLQKFWFLYF